MSIMSMVFICSLILTGVVRQYALHRRILDIPNIRSSHSVATPRGGGIGLVVVFVLTVLSFVQRSIVSGSLGLALAGGGLLVAAVGLLDDHFGVSARSRLLIHFAAAGWALWQVGDVKRLDLGWISWNWAWGGWLLALVGLVWMVNLYNFMDGIDGIAGVEAVCASGMGGVLLVCSGFGGLAAGALALAGASAGFLVWNWPPAKIFMGDVGSGFLGFAFGVLVIASIRERPWLLWPWLILLAVFVVDSTMTLVRRMLDGARWYEAHCTHAYQHAARQWGHAKVTLTVTSINVLWLFPLALGACVWPAIGALFALVAAAPLIYLAFRFKAGKDLSARTVSCPGTGILAAVDSQA